MPQHNDRGILYDAGLAIKKAGGVLLSGAVFRDAAARRRVLRKARWLTFKHLGIDQIVLPFHGGMKLCVKTSDDVIACDVYLDGHFCYEEFAEAMHQLKRLRPALSDQAIFVDVGANIGTHSLYALQSRQFRRVVSVEPEPDNFALLVQNLRINGFDASDAVNAGLSNQIGKGFLSVSRDNLGDHRLVKSASGDGPPAHSLFKSVALTDFATLSNTLEMPVGADMLFWIDTQGHEYEVLSGIGADLLARSVVVVEFWPALLQKNGTLDGFLRLVNEVIGKFVILQERNSAFAGVADLMPLAERLLKQPFPADQVDLLCVGAHHPAVLEL